jgi:hypothetical protein
MLLQLQKVLIGAFIPHLDKELKLPPGVFFLIYLTLYLQSVDH